MKYWCRLGIWVGLAAGFYILVNEVLQKYAFYETWRWHIYKVLIGGGALLAIMAKRSRQAKAQARPQGQGNGQISFKGDDSEEDSSGRIFSQRYCGFILTTFGVIVRVVIPAEDVEMRVAARTEARQQAEEKEEEPVVKTFGPVTFPELRVQGVACSKSNPSAIINRKTYVVGDIIEGAKLAAILPDSIIMEKDGRKQAYHLTIGSSAATQAKGRP